MSSTPNPVGRPPLPIDASKVMQLAAMYLTVAEIAAVLDCSADTLQRNFAAELKKGREQGAASLKRTMFTKAMGGDTTMLIWLSKNHLGMSDKIETTNNHLHQFVNVEALKAMTPEERRARILELTGRLNLLPAAVVPNQDDGKTIEGTHVHDVATEGVNSNRGHEGTSTNKQLDTGGVKK